MLKHTSLAARLITCAAIILFSALTTQAQFRAALQGTVTDESGAVVAGATVTLTSTETNRTQNTTTSDDGFYRFSQLAPGTYNITVEQAGFNRSVLDNIIIAAEDTQGIDVQLTTGAVTESVTISDSAPALDTETANIRGVITQEEVRQLPQVGRNPYELARTAPGVFGNTARAGTGNSAQFIPGVEQLGGGSNSGAFQTENQTQISANGQRVSSNNYQIDGVSVNSLGLGGAAVVTPNQESVKEVSVVSSSYSAEDGRNTGAQVKVVSQNGTNEFHGSLVGNYASPRLNAFNKFPNPTRVDQYERKFAGSLGGPVYLPRFGEGGPAYFSGKDKLFFFVSGEILRRSNIGFNDTFIETPEFRNYINSVRPTGNAARFFNFPGTQPRTVATGLNTRTPLSDTALFRPVNGQLGLSYDIGSLNAPLGQNIGTVAFDGIPDITLARVVIPSRTRGNQYNARVDYNLGTNNQFAVSTFFTPLKNFGGSATGREFEDLPFEPLNSAATVTYIRTLSPTLINEARANFTRFSANELGFIGGDNLSIPRLQIQGFNQPFNAIGAFAFGINRGTPNSRTQNTYEFRDTVTNVRGNQAIKIGFEFRREQNNNNEIAEGRPEYTFTSFLNFANDSAFFQNIAVDPRTGGAANGQRYFRSNAYGAFIQDDFKARPNLTLNLGVRWEYQAPLTEKEGRLTNYEFGSNGIFDGRVVTVDRLYNPDRNNFAPRLGFAYSPSFKSFGGILNENRAVIRGGFGIAYDRIFQNQLVGVRGNPPFFARAGLCCSSTNNATDPGPILYSFALPGGNPFNYPLNPALVQGIDSQTGGLLAGSPTTLPGGFIRRDVPVEINGTPRELPNAYVYSYSLELQYQITPKTVVSAGYQGSAGRKLIRTVDLNRFFPGDTFGTNNRDRVQVADVNGNAITPRLRGNPNFDRIIFALPDVNSNYNALLLRASRNYARNFTLETNYRFAKSIDTSSFGRGAQQTEPSNQSLERGPSDFDVRHNFVLSGLYRIPFFNDGRGFVGKLLGGFEINGIVSYNSGFPFTPVVFGDEANDLNGDGFRPDRPTRYFGGVIQNPTNSDFLTGIFPGGGTRYFDTTTRGSAGIGRNSFRGPGYRSVDLSIVKQTRMPFLGLGERANLDLRANLFNAFNLLNLPSFQPVTPQVDIGNPSFGRPTFGLSGRIVELQARFSF